MQYKIQHNSIVKARLQAFFDKHKCIKKASTRFCKTLTSEESERLEALASEVKFNTRRYGKGDWFCWPLHVVFTERGIDPWPANRYPKAALIADLALRTNIVS